MITGVWLSPDGDQVAVQFADGTIGVESHGGSRAVAEASATADEIVTNWRNLHR